MVTITDGVITRTLSCDQWALLNETPPSGFTVTANTCASSVTAFYSPFASVTLGDGTVVYVGLTMPASVFDVDGSPVTSSGTFEVTLIAQNANKVWAGPVSGADALPVFRALVANDIPNLSALNGLLNLTQIAQGGATSGQVLTWNGSNWVAQTPTAGITGSGAAGQIAYWNGTGSITGSNNNTFDGQNQTVFGFLRANNQDANKVYLGAASGFANYPGIWFGSATPTISNYAFLFDSGLPSTILNTPSGGRLSLRVNNSEFVRLISTGLYVGGSGSPAQTLHVAGTARITGSAGTPTALMGRDVNGDIASIGTGATNGQVLQWNGTTWVPATPASGTIGGSIAATRVAYGSGTDTITGEAEFLYTAATNRLQVGAGTPLAAFNAFFGSVTTEEAFRGSANASGSIIMLLQNAWGSGGTGNSIFQILTASGGGDPVIQFGVTGGSPGFAVGIDNSDADKFKITRDAALPGETGNSSFVITNEATPKYGFNVDAPAYVIDMNERARFGQVMSRAVTYAAPTPGTGAGTGPTFTVTNATGNGFIINITTGTSPTLNGNIVTVTIPWFSSGAVNATFSAYNDLAASHISRFKIGSTSNNNITLTNCNTALSASSTYALMVVFFG